MNKRVVISGGPCTGKTSIINTLDKIGYPCLHEFSRHIIEEGIRTQNNIVPWGNLPAFTEKVFEGRIEQFNKGNEVKLAFYDRSIVDSIAYMEYDAVEVPQKYIQGALEYRYFPKVFVTPFWEEIYTTDDQRIEPIEKAQRLERYIIESYQKFDYEVLIVPKMSIQDRIDFILDHINE